MDDGSTDETPSRLAAYRDLRIRSIRQDNMVGVRLVPGGSHSREPLRLCFSTPTIACTRMLWPAT